MSAGLFDQQFRLEELSKMGDPLEVLDEHVDFESFRSAIDSHFPERDKKKGGRPSYDRIMMLKGLLLKSTYNLSFEKLEYHIKDRLSFQRFLGLTLADRVPDGNTFWDFNEVLVTVGLLDEIFLLLKKQLIAKGLIMNNGSLVDACIVNAPIQRNKKDENASIKKGETPSDWSENKKSQKDVDAAWTKKRGVNRYGYKNHIKVDKGSKLISNFEVTDASVHDSQVLIELLDENDSHHELYADSAYRSNKIEQELKARKIRSRIHEKGYRDKPLTEKQKTRNKKKSKTRARVEHVFGDIHQKMKRVTVRQIGLARNTAAITLMNICYNMRRSCYLLSNK